MANHHHQPPTFTLHHRGERHLHKLLVTDRNDALHLAISATERVGEVLELNVGDDEVVESHPSCLGVKLGHQERDELWAEAVTHLLNCCGGKQNVNEGEKVDGMTKE